MKAADISVVRNTTGRGPAIWVEAQDGEVIYRAPVFGTVKDGLRIGEVERVRVIGGVRIGAQGASVPIGDVPELATHLEEIYVSVVAALTTVS